MAKKIMAKNIKKYIVPIFLNYELYKHNNTKIILLQDLKKKKSPM